MSTVDDQPMPKSYESPLLSWFRGGAVMLNNKAGRLQVHAEFDLQRAEGSGPRLPLLQGLPKLFGLGSRRAEDPNPGNSRSVQDLNGQEGKDAAKADGPR